MRFPPTFGATVLALALAGPALAAPGTAGGTTGGGGQQPPKQNPQDEQKHKHALDLVQQARKLRADVDRAESGVALEKAEEDFERALEEAEQLDQKAAQEELLAKLAPGLLEMVKRNWRDVKDAEADVRQNEDALLAVKVELERLEPRTREVPNHTLSRLEMQFLHVQLELLQRFVSMHRTKMQVAQQALDKLAPGFKEGDDVELERSLELHTHNAEKLYRDAEQMRSNATTNREKAYEAQKQALARVEQDLAQAGKLETEATPALTEAERNMVVAHILWFGANAEERRAKLLPAQAKEETALVKVCTDQAAVHDGLVKRCNAEALAAKQEADRQGKAGNDCRSEAQAHQDRAKAINKEVSDIATEVRQVRAEAQKLDPNVGKD
jgi:hypothetical protein